MLVNTNSSFFGSFKKKAAAATQILLLHLFRGARYHQTFSETRDTAPKSIQARRLLVTVVYCGQFGPVLFLCIHATQHTVNNRQ